MQTRRLKQNRLAARKSRQRRKDYVVSLEQQVIALTILRVPFVLSALQCVMLVSIRPAFGSVDRHLAVS